MHFMVEANHITWNVKLVSHNLSSASAIDVDSLIVSISSNLQDRPFLLSSANFHLRRHLLLKEARYLLRLAVIAIMPTFTRSDHDHANFNSLFCQIGYHLVGILYADVMDR